LIERYMYAEKMTRKVVGRNATDDYSFPFTITVALEKNLASDYG
jgi:hypothetical protein